MSITILIGFAFLKLVFFIYFLFYAYKVLYQHKFEYRLQMYGYAIVYAIVYAIGYAIGYAIIGFAITISRMVYGGAMGIL